MSNGYSLNDVTAWDWARAIHLQNDNKLVVLVSAILYRYQSYIVLNDLEIDRTHWFIYPNPTSDVFHLDQRYDTVVLYDQSGKQLFVGNQIEEVDLSFFENGVYFVQVKLNSGEYRTQKVVKK